MLPERSEYMVCQGCVFFLLAGYGVQLARGLVRNHNPDKSYTHLSLVTVLDRLEVTKM